MDSSYNFVFYTVDGGYSEPLYGPLEEKECVRCYRRAFNSVGIVTSLFSLHWSSKINHRIALPFKKIWFKRMYQQSFTDDKPLCFVFKGGKYALEAPEYMDYIHKQNPNNRCVVAFDDLVSKKGIKQLGELFNKADSVLSYDPSECESFGMSYLENLYYSPLIEVTEPESFEWDVYFLGFAKDRLDTIHRAWRHFSRGGLRCRFLVAGTKPEQRIEGEGLHYIDKPIPYRQSLKDIAASRCVLELIQGSSVAATMRTLEAVTYKRKLISNCPTLADSPLYCPNNMFCFTQVEDIDTDFAKEPIDYEAYRDVNPKSPDEYLSEINRRLSEVKPHAH